MPKHSLTQIIRLACCSAGPVGAVPRWPEGCPDGSGWPGWATDPAGPAGSGLGGALLAGPRASMVWIRLGQLEMLPLAQRRNGLTRPATAAQNRLPCIK